MNDNLPLWAWPVGFASIVVAACAWSDDESIAAASLLYLIGNEIDRDRY